MRADFTLDGRCNCGLPRAWAADGQHPVSYDATAGEYRFAGGGVLHYCPFCGGRLPESARSELFILLDETEADAALTLATRLRSKADVLHWLGEPDEVATCERSASDDGTRWREQLTYRRRFESIELLIDIDADGRPTCRCLPKEKRDLFA